MNESLDLVEVAYEAVQTLPDETKKVFDEIAKDKPESYKFGNRYILIVSEDVLHQSRENELEKPGYWYSTVEVTRNRKLCENIMIPKRSNWISGYVELLDAVWLCPIRSTSLTPLFKKGWAGLGSIRLPFQMDIDEYLNFGMLDTIARTVLHGVSSSGERIFIELSVNLGTGVDSSGNRRAYHSISGQQQMRQAGVILRLSTDRTSSSFTQPMRFREMTMRVEADIPVTLNAVESLDTLHIDESITYYAGSETNSIRDLGDCQICFQVQNPDTIIRLHWQLTLSQPQEQPKARRSRSSESIRSVSHLKSRIRADRHGTHQRC